MAPGPVPSYPSRISILIPVQRTTSASPFPSPATRSGDMFEGHPSGSGARRDGLQREPAPASVPVPARTQMVDHRALHAVAPRQFVERELRITEDEADGHRVVRGPLLAHQVEAVLE